MIFELDVLILLLIPAAVMALQIRDLLAAVHGIRNLQLSYVPTMG